ncbi:MAG: GspH/FimT family pseudopilin [Rhodanobacteraceae bacterium]
MPATTPHRNRGISLIETMLGLALIAIMLAAAAPAFGTLIARNEADVSRGTLVAALETARILAVSRSRHVVVCPSADQSYCGPTTEWQHGWIVFSDTNHDGARDADEPVLSVTQADTAGVAILSGAGRKRIDFRPDGSSPGSNATFTICDARGAGNAQSIVINNAGRLRAGTPTAAAAAACEAVLAGASA